MAIGTVEVGAPVNLTASGIVAGGTAMPRTFPGGGNDQGSVAETTVLQGAILGFYVNSTSSGTVVLSSVSAAGGAGTAFTGTITPAIGWNFFPVVNANGIYCTIGATLNVTFIVVE
jgi:hypothetical protein